MPRLVADRIGGLVLEASGREDAEADGLEQMHERIEDRHRARLLVSRVLTMALQVGVRTMDRSSAPSSGRPRN
ncbi:hypothetical protein [Nannocystis pusilla]|uniref:hypothetical protein n=1 Tax=Nannocystis pusilla TaxID=889268 RepID=UPI003BF396B2